MHGGKRLETQRPPKGQEALLLTKSWTTPSLMSPEATDMHKRCMGGPLADTTLTNRRRRYNIPETTSEIYGAALVDAQPPSTIYKEMSRKKTGSSVLL